MGQVCLVNLVGLPASGKTTFCRRFCEHFRKKGDVSINVLHIEFDEYVKIPTDAHSAEYFESKTFKTERFRVRCLIREVISGIKRDASIDEVLHLARIEYPESELRSVQVASSADYIILIDDNMYYASMRKEVRSIAKQYEIGYLIVYLETSLADAIAKNELRSLRDRVDEAHIRSMAERFEPPDECQDRNIIRIGGEKDMSVVFDKIQSAVLECLLNPQRPEPITDQAPVAFEQSEIHRIDLMLRKEISQLMRGSAMEVDKKALSEILCQRRKHILNDLKSGALDTPDDLEELRMLLRR